MERYCGGAGRGHKQKKDKKQQTIKLHYFLIAPRKITLLIILILHLEHSCVNK